MDKNKLTKIMKGLHWTTTASERVLLSIIGIVTCLAAVKYLYSMHLNMDVTLADLFMLFIYVEIIGMVGAFYSTTRIPVTLPLIIAMTALTRMIILQSKDLNAINIIYEATGILILAISAYIMTLKDKISLKKLLLREKIDESDIPD